MAGQIMQMGDLVPPEGGGEEPEYVCVAVPECRPMLGTVIAWNAEAITADGDDPGCLVLRLDGGRVVALPHDSYIGVVRESVWGRDGVEEFAKEWDAVVYRLWK